MSNDYFTTKGYEQKEKSASLIIAGKPSEAVRVIPLFGSMSLGRDYPGDAADITLNSKIVSRKHGLFTWDGDICYYTDTNSLNGTYLNGKKLEKCNERGSRAVRLKDGDILRIDKRDLDRPHEEAVTMIFSTSYDLRSKWEKYHLKDSSSISIGRGDENGIDLVQSYISKEHAVIFARGGRYYIKNCDSTNGVYVNNSPVSDTAELHERNVIRICDTLIFVLDGVLLYNVNNITGVGLKIDIEETVVKENLKKKKLLSDIHAEIDNGDFVLILGGSGAGKSTLVNSTLGKYKIKGNIEVDGSRKKGNKIAYVPQKLQIRAEERLIHAVTDTAILRMNGKLSASKRKKFIDDTLDSLGLLSKKNTAIKNLSGGEQRRAAIANEAVTNPDIFFLDEPDSGLDPESGFQLMLNLKQLSDNGKIIMLISHNYASYPNPEKIYTKIIVLAKSDRDKTGKLAFIGTVEEALYFFGVKELKNITKLINPKSENGDGRADEFVEKFKRMQV